MAFNRTILELKLMLICGISKMSITFNRTILELKLRSKLIGLVQKRTFNRTILELKQFGMRNRVK